MQKKIQEHLDNLAIANDTFVYSGHKTPRELLDQIDLLNTSYQPLVIITVAGLHDDLSGIVAANSVWPVIACPPDSKDYNKYPSYCPVTHQPDPLNAALAAERIFGIIDEEKRMIIADGIQDVKDEILGANEK